MSPQASRIQYTAAGQLQSSTAGHPAIRVTDFILDPREMPRKDFYADIAGLGIKDTSLFARSTDIMRAPSLERQLEKAVGRSTMLPYHFLSKGIQIGRAVCKILVEDRNAQGGHESWSGTGFLVAPGILLTNNHVISSLDLSARAIFDYEEDDQGQPTPTRSFSIDPSRLFITSPFSADGSFGLDYTFVGIDMDDEAMRHYGHVPLLRSSFLAKLHDFANVIHHPHGTYKRISLQENLIAGMTEVLMHYTSDTEPGSSGSPVFTNGWKLIALHHASMNNSQGLNPLNMPTPPEYLNEGIRISAIEADLVRRLHGDEAPHVQKALAAFKGVDSLAGYFGTRGRPALPIGREARTQGEASGVEGVVNSYSGEARDIDVAFWNIEWFATGYKQKLDDVATIIADLNLDIWALSESSPEATQALVEHLEKKWGMLYDCAFSEPGAPSGKQTTTVIWNTQTVERKDAQWPEDIDAWFKVNSRQFKELRLEAVHGKVFDRYPGLFSFAGKNREAMEMEPFDFFLVPLHLKAKGEGQLRRRMATQILGAAIMKMVASRQYDADWVVGGDFNAELATQDFQNFEDRGFVPLSAADELEGAFSYLKGPKSLIDHVFLSPNLAKQYGAEDFFIVARDRADLSYIKKISDHRPVLVRLSLCDRAEAGVSRLPQDLENALELFTPRIPQDLERALESFTNRLARAKAA